MEREIIPISVIPEDAESNTNSNCSPDQQNVHMSTVPPSSSTPAFTATGSGTSGGIVKSITMNEPIATESGKPIASNKFTRKRERVCNNSS